MCMILIVIIIVMFPLIGARFSPDMSPDQLEQWLIQEYGEAYKHEISKLKGIMICSKRLSLKTDMIS